MMTAAAFTTLFCIGFILSNGAIILQTWIYETIVHESGKLHRATSQWMVSILAVHAACKKADWTGLNWLRPSIELRVRT